MRPVIRESVVWRSEVRRTRADVLTAEERENVRKVLLQLRDEAGDMVVLARWLGMPYQSVRHLFVTTRPVSMKTALRVARASGLRLETVLGERWAWDDLRIMIDHIDSVDGLERAVRRTWALWYYVLDKTPVAKCILSSQYSYFRFAKETT